MPFLTLLDSGVRVRLPGRSQSNVAAGGTHEPYPVLDRRLLPWLTGAPTRWGRYDDIR